MLQNKLLLMIADIDELIKINDDLYVDLKDYKNIDLDRLDKQYFMIQSKLSNQIYHFLVSKCKFLENGVLRIYFVKQCLLLKEDYVYQESLKHKNDKDEEKIYYTKHKGRSFLLLNMRLDIQSLSLDLKYSNNITNLNECIKNRNLKFVFNNHNEMKRIKSVIIRINKEQNCCHYYIEFYKDNDGIKDVGQYIKNNIVLSKNKYGIIGNSNTVSFYDVKSKSKNNVKNKINSENIYYRNEKTHYKKENIIVVNTLQIINSNNNHVSKNHTILDKSFYLRLKKNKYEAGFNLMKYNGHYCIECKKYFDFKNSFLIQLKNQNVSVKKIETTLVDEMDRHISLEQIKYEMFDKETILHQYGYRTGKSGISANKRREIIDKLIRNQILDVSEIKLILNRNISSFKHNKKYSIAVNDWKSDIDYINNQYY